MDFVSLDDARDQLMGRDIRPLAEDEDASDAQDEQEESNDSSCERVDEENDALFEAKLEAAFGSVDASCSNSQDDLTKTVAALQDETAQAFALDDSMVGLGIDIVEIGRMRAILMRNPSFASKVFSVEEQIYCDSHSNSAAHYAARFAAKEAVVKALGTGFSEGIGVRDIEVERAKNGRPKVKLSGNALKNAQMKGVVDITLSMSYTKTDAVACAMALTQASLLATEKRKDPKKELAQQFKETRKILDDL